MVEHQLVSIKNILFMCVFLVDSYIVPTAVPACKQIWTLRGTLPSVEPTVEQTQQAFARTSVITYQTTGTMSLRSIHDLGIPDFLLSECNVVTLDDRYLRKIPDASSNT